MSKLLWQRASTWDRAAHYQKGGIECIDALRAALTPEEFEGFCKANIIKYLWRERHKGELADLRKANDYLNWLIESKETHDDRNDCAQAPSAGDEGER